MPINLDGLSTQSKETIQKLRKVEEKKLLTYDLHVAELDFQNNALAELRKKAHDLQISLESLYNFDSPFEKKSVEFSAEGYMEGVANKNASFGTHSVAIKNLATKLSLASKSISPDQNLNESDFTINDKKAHFPGGTLDDLKNFLSKNFKETLTPKIVKKNASESILILESNQEGEKGLLKLSDSSGILKSMELTGDATASPEISKKKQQTPDSAGGPRENYVPVTFSLDRLSVTNEGPTSIGENQKSLSIGNAAARRLELPTEAKPGEKIKAITFEVTPGSKPASTQEADTTPSDLTEGPVNTINVKGIILKSYNITRAREKEPAPQPSQDFDFGVVLPDTGPHSLKNGGFLVSIPLTKAPAYIEFYTRNKEVTFKNLQLVYSVTEKEKPPEQETPETNEEDENIAKQKALFPHLINPAKNAKLNIDGIDIERENNEGLKDIIDGATFDLKKPTESPIEVTITANLKKSHEMMTDFMDKYNELLDFTKAVSAGVKKNAEGQIETLSEDERKKTPLITSSLVRSMINGLQSRVSNAYPANLDPKIKILQMIGIGTGKPNSSWQEISQMHLQFENKDLFDEMVSKYPAAVKDFFGQDKNGDRSFDDGMAFQMVEFLKAYTTQLKNGVIQSQITSNKSRIKDLKTGKEKKAASIDEYEKKLRSKFGHMEAVIQESKSTGETLRQRFGQDK